MASSPFPGMDPFLEQNPQCQVFHGWFIRKLAEQSIGPARDLGCTIDVERSIYGRETTGELVLYGEPDVMLSRDHVQLNRKSTGATLALAEPQAIHEVVLADDEREIHKQEYWLRYGEQPVPDPPLSDADRAWVEETIGSMHR